tara:strand:- start:162 stop:500 length:339 start_codon:yes stop_codon:yes gene_type:complete
VKDPTVPVPKERKKIMFYDSEDRQTKLKIRCMHDEISQSQFFRMMITGYIENDEMIRSFLNSCKEKYKIQGQQKRNKTNKLQEAARKTTQKFALGAEEIEDIFDMIETETNI